MILISWLTFIYKVPNKPSSNRLYVWRKLKKLGAVSLQDAIFILPYNFRNLENLQWLSEEVKEMKGECFIFQSDAIGIYNDQNIISKFKENAESLYESIEKRILQIHDDDNRFNPSKFTALYRSFMEIRKRDFFKSERGNKIYEIFKSIEKRMLEQEGAIDEVDNME